MGFYHTVRKALCIDGKAMIHRGNLDLPGLMIFHRVVRAMMAMVHFDGLRT